MNGAAVIALVVVFHDDLPVGGHVIGNRFRRAQLTQKITFERFRDEAQWRRKGAFAAGSLFGRQIKEEKSPPGLKPHGVQGKFLLLKTSALGQEGRAQQSPIEGVGPLMIRTANRRRRGESAAKVYMPFRVAATQTGPAMATDIVMGLEISFFGSGHENTLAHHIEDQKAAVGGKIFVAAGTKPLLTEDGFLFALVDLGRIVVRAG